MSGSERDRPSLSFWATVAVAICVGLVVAYVLSIGPACWLMDRDYLNAGAYATFYRPLFIAAEQCSPLGDFLVYWVMIWSPAELP